MAIGAQMQKSKNNYCTRRNPCREGGKKAALKAFFTPAWDNRCTNAENPVGGRVIYISHRAF